jgi:uncharacterized membrane protein (DUF4010 family)
LTDEHLTGLLVALGIGLLMGVERERRKGSGSGRRLAGVRTFALASLAGALAEISGLPGLALLGAALVAGLTLIAYRRGRAEDPGVTTELALFVAYLVGVTAVSHPAVAAATGVVVTVLLAAREHLHRFSTQWLTQQELRDLLLLTGVALVVLPLLPDRALFGEFFNPRTLGRLVAVLLAIQVLGHVGQRVLGARHGLVLAGLAAGFVSSTATIATMGSRARAYPAELAGCVRAAVASNIATMAQLLLVAAAVQPAWLAALWLPALCGGAVALAFSFLGKSAGPSAAATPQPERAAIRLRDALLVAGVITVVQLAAQFLKAEFGAAGLTAAAAVAGFADVHAAAAALFTLEAPMAQGEAARMLAVPMTAALLTNMASKLVAAQVAGGAAFLARVAPAVLAMSAAFAAVLWLQGG